MMEGNEYCQSVTLAAVPESTFACVALVVSQWLLFCPLRGQPVCFLHVLLPWLKREPTSVIAMQNIHQ